MGLGNQFVHIAQQSYARCADNAAWAIVAVDVY